MKLKKFFFIGVFIFLIIIFATLSIWLSDAEKKEIVRKKENFIDNNENFVCDYIKDFPANIMWKPFVLWINIIHIGNYVGFLNGF